MPPFRPRSSSDVEADATGARSGEPNPQPPFIGPPPSAIDRIAKLENRSEQVARSVNVLNARAAGIEKGFQELLSLMETYMNEAAAHQAAAARSSEPRSAVSWPWRVATALSLVGLTAAATTFVVSRPVRPIESIRQPAVPMAPAAGAMVASAPASPEAPQVAAATVSPATDSPPGTQVPGLVDLRLEATEPAWVSLTTSTGVTLLNRLLEPGAVTSMQLDGPARLRTGNAGGLLVTIAGRPIGVLGPHARVREIDVDALGGFKPVPLRSLTPASADAPTTAP